MPRRSDKKLLTLISLMPVVLIGIFTFILNAVVIHENKTKVETLITSLHSESIEKEKDQIEHQVDTILQQISYQQNLTEETLKRSIKLRVDDAYSTLSFIYQKNKNKPKSEIIALISDALRQSRFNDGRGYFFIYGMDGINLMHPIFPHLEGENLLQTKDVRGAYPVKNYIKMMKDKGEGFSRWWYPKPDVKNVEFEKIGYAKWFKPLDFYIGTGEYIVNIEEDIKQKLLAWISEVRFGDHGYIFLLDQYGNTLAHYNKLKIAPNKYTKESPNQGPLTQRILALANRGGGFMQYISAFKPGTSEQAEKLSFIKEYHEWGWVLGAGVYTDENKLLLEKKEALLLKQNKMELTKILLLTLSLALVLTMLSLGVSKYIGMRFNQFKRRIKSDFTLLEKTKNKMQYMALHDELTQLPNRVLLESKIEQAIQQAKEAKQYLAVMFVDLDDFKKINDRFGHEVGDLLLKSISHKFDELLYNDEIVSRFGGDEFVFCIPSLNSKEEAEQKVKTIQSVFKESFAINGKSINTSCSIGVAMYPSDADTSLDLISKADIVLYKSKAKRKGSALFFDHTIDAQVNYEFSLEEELRTALSNNEISVMYQPQIDIETGELYGVEALSRWHNKTLGFVSPVDFIAVAEEIGGIDAIGDFVLQRACEDILTLMANGLGAVMVSVNLSPKQLIQPDFIQRVTAIVDTTGIDISRVTLEITENILISDLEEVSPILTQLQQLGFGISLDDFGTGYSSLSYLNILPITEIKIDRSFINSLFINQQSETLVKAIIAIGASCHMKVVAEGVETKEQLNKLIEYKCDLVQGYYFDKPLSIHDLCIKYSVNSLV
ncbi:MULTISPECIES: cache domain-containing protein [unclassified Aliivibrio]|uniref:bifunctional diguanylate cyclase/phosphodiesterase n=1 Tax=unclassified Aliivibrio TaxID=2645654 RepID=UPI000A4ED5EA|nr:MULTISPECIES: cache domain-containing protein [unclassified Aliivibrio]